MHRREGDMEYLTKPVNKVTQKRTLGKHGTWPALTRSDVMRVSSAVRRGLLRGITSSLRATRSV